MGWGAYGASVAGPGFGTERGTGRGAFCALAGIDSKNRSKRAEFLCMDDLGKTISPINFATNFKPTMARIAVGPVLSYAMDYVNQMLTINLTHPAPLDRPIALRM